VAKKEKKRGEGANIFRKTEKNGVLVVVLGEKREKKTCALVGWLKGKTLL